MDRRTFIKGLIRCAPAIVVPKLVFDLAPRCVLSPPCCSYEWMFSTPRPRRFNMQREGDAFIYTEVPVYKKGRINPAYIVATHEEVFWNEGIYINRTELSKGVA